MFSGLEVQFSITPLFAPVGITYYVIGNLIVFLALRATSKNVGKKSGNCVAGLFAIFDKRVVSVPPIGYYIYGS